MDQNDTSTEETTSDWPAFSADRTLAKSAARSLRIDTQQAGADGKILEFNTELAQLRNRLTTVERQAFDLPSADGPVDNEMLAFREDMLRTRARFEELSSRVSAAEEHISTTLIQSIDGFDTRLALIEEVRLTQTKELNELTGYLEQAFQRIAELAEVVESQQGTVDDIRSEVSGALEQELSARQEVADALSQVESSLTRFDSVEVAIQAVESELKEVKNFAQATAEQGEAHQIELARHTESVDRRITELESAVNALPSSDAIGAEAAVNPEVLLKFEADLEAHAEKLVSHTQRFDAQTESIQDLDERAAAVNTTLDEFKGTIEQQSQQIARQSETLSSQTEIFEVQIGALEEHKAALASHQAAIIEIQDLQLGLDNPDQELAGDRLTSIEDTTGSLQSSVEDISAKVEDLSTKFDEASIQIEENGGSTDEERARIDALEQATQDLETRIGEVADSQQQPDAAGQDSESIKTLRADLEALASQVEATSEDAGLSNALSTRIDSLASQANEAELRHNDDLARATEAGAKVDEITTRVNGFSEEFDLLTDLATGSSTRIDTIAEDLSTVNTRIDEIASHAESQSGEQIDTGAIEALVASATDTSGSAKERADEAYRLAENLRMIQTDLVQAIQSELTSHGERLDGIEDGEETNTRIEHVESKLVEAWQTISQLTELQRRHTQVETQITDTLTSTTQGVEYTQQHVIAMRTELESALQRVARLEAMLSGGAATAAAPVAAPAAAPPAAPVAPVAQEVAPVAAAAPVQPKGTQPAADVDEDGTDTEWFTESYSRRNAS